MFVCVNVCIYVRLFAEVTCKMRHIRDLCNPVRDRCEGNLCVGGCILCISICTIVWLYVCVFICVYVCRYVIKSGSKKKGVCVCVCVFGCVCIRVAHILRLCVCGFL